MGQMVNDMLFLAQADNAAAPTDTTAVNVAAEVDALFAYYESWADERGVSLKREGTATVAGDRLMMQRALGNLVSNAIRHTPPGGTVRVEITEPAEGRVAIVVENPGASIPAEHLPKLFDRFYRVDASRQRNGEGAGLGLAITKSVIDAHGGNIEAQSTGGRTRFRITMPGSPAEATPG